MRWHFSSPAMPPQYKMLKIMKIIRQLFTKTLLVLFLPVVCFSQESEVFKPQSPKKEIEALKITENININGRLDEADWAAAKSATGFFRQTPNQGGTLAFDTKAWILYDNKNLYIGFFCPDSLGKKAIRVPNLQRDFDWGNNDLVGVNFDAFNDKRSTSIFQTNPYSGQRDMQVFDDSFFDIEWDAYWKVRTSRSDSGWVAEMQIPWSTLRYPKGETQDWGIQFVRKTRRLGEQSSWSAHPRAFTPYRMDYAGILKGISPRHLHRILGRNRIC